MSRRIKSALGWGAWIAGAGLTAFLVRRLGVGAIAGALGRVGPRFLWIVAAYALATAVAAVPWALLVPRLDRPSWIAVVTGRFAASGLSAVLPFFGLGEAGRLLWMRRLAWPSGTAAIVVDRLLYLVAGALFLMGAAAAATSLRGLPPRLATGAAVVALSIVAGVAGVAIIAAHGQLGRTWDRVTRRAADAGGHRGERRPWETALRRLLIGPRRPLLASLSVHLMARLLFAVEIYAGLRLLGLPSGWRPTLIFAAVPIALSVVGTFVPGQLGIQEATQALVATALGIGPVAGVTLVLLQRARQLLFVPLSALLIGLHARGDRGAES